MPSGHARAVVAGTTVAETDTYELVEGNVYFPPSSIRSEYFRSTDHHTYCPWKGQAHYYSILVKEGGDELKNAAWHYPDTKETAEQIKGYVAFYKGKVEITHS
jgi:uncharacterized protein (DUF427 family)